MCRAFESPKGGATLRAAEPKKKNTLEIGADFLFVVRVQFVCKFRCNLIYSRCIARRVIVTRNTPKTIVALRKNPESIATQQTRDWKGRLKSIFQSFKIPCVQRHHLTGLLAGGAFAPYKRFRRRRKPWRRANSFRPSILNQRVEPPSERRNPKRRTSALQMSFFLVEVRGVEPLSENNSTGLSPGAGDYCGRRDRPVPLPPGKPPRLPVR